MTLCVWTFLRYDKSDSIAVNVIVGHERCDHGLFSEYRMHIVLSLAQLVFFKVLIRK